MQDRSQSQRFSSFADFYPFYLSEHQNTTSRRLHVIGTSLIIPIFLVVIATKSWTGLILLPICGYGLAWIGHFFFEKNTPATFKYPLWSLAGDWLMWKDVLTGRIKW